MEDETETQHSAVTQVTSTDRAHWNDDMLETFLICILNLAHRENVQGSNFRTTQWNTITKDFNRGSEVQLSKDKLENKFSVLRKKYTTYTKLLHQSGFGFDSQRKVVTAPSEVWDDYLQYHPEAAEFRVKTLPFYNLLEQIFGGRKSVGSWSSSSLSPVSSVRSDPPVARESSAAALASSSGSNPLTQEVIEVRDDPHIGEKRVRETEDHESLSNKKSKKKKIDEVLKVMHTIIEKNPSTRVDKAIELFDGEFSYLSCKEKIKCKKVLVQDNNWLAFLNMNEEERKGLIEEFLKG